MRIRITQLRAGCSNSILKNIANIYFSHTHAKVPQMGRVIYVNSSVLVIGVVYEDTDYAGCSKGILKNIEKYSC